MCAQCGGPMCMRALAESYPGSIWLAIRGHWQSGSLLRAGLPDHLACGCALARGGAAFALVWVLRLLRCVCAPPSVRSALLTTLHAAALCGSALACRRWPGVRAPCVLTYYYYSKQA